MSQEKQESPIWARYQLTMTFTTPLCGGVPRDDEIVRRWVELRAPTEAALKRMQDPTKMLHGTPQPLVDVQEEAAANVEPPPVTEGELMNRVWVGFFRDAGGLFVRGGSLRAHLKDCATCVSRLTGLDLPKQFRSKFVDSVYIEEDRVYLHANGQVAQQPSDYRDATLSVMTAQGPRTCLKRIDQLKDASLTATIKLAKHKDLNRDHLSLVLEYGAVHGFNQDRSLQYGRYTWELSD